MSLKIIHLHGNLGRDAELRYAPSGNPVLRFTMACTTMQGVGEHRQEHTDWFTVTMFGRRAEAIAQYLRKGTRVVVAGRFQHRTFARQDGSPGCVLEVLATDIDFASSGRPEGTPATRSLQGPGPRPSEDVLADEDVPF